MHGVDRWDAWGGLVRPVQKCILPACCRVPCQQHKKRNEKAQVVFNIFRRSRPTPLTPAAPEAAQPPPDKATAAAASRAARGDTNPAPLEVVEGNADTDWKLWEQAVTSQPGGKSSQWEKTWPGMEAPPPATPSQLEETVRMKRLPSQS